MNAPVKPSGLSLSSLRQKREPRGPNLNYGNIHLQVEAYIRDEKTNVAVAVQGINLKTGEEAIIGLADGDRYARFYTSSNDDMSIRLETAKKATSGRATISEYAGKKGNKTVPTDGVITFSDVRRDHSNQLLYARWLNAVTTDPNTEIALKGAFQVNSFRAKDRNGDAFTSYYVQGIFPDRAKAGEDLTRDDVDMFLSASLLHTDAPLRTNIAVTVALYGEVETWVLKSPMVRQEDGSVITASGLEAALSAGLNGNDALAGAAVAATVGIPFDQINFGEKADVDACAQVYDFVASGDAKVVVTPGATMAPTKYQALAFAGQRLDKEDKIVPVNNIDKHWPKRGYEYGVVGLRYVSAASEQIIEPKIKAIFADERLADVKSDFYVRKDLNYIGEQTFNAVYGPEVLTEMKLAASSSQNFENRSEDLEEDYSNDYGNDYNYGDDAGPAF